MLTAFGTVAVSIMMLSYWLEPHSRWYVALFALGCGLSSMYAWLAGALPFFVVEAVWMVVAFRRFLDRSRQEVAHHAL